MVDPLRRVFLRLDCELRAELHSSMSGKICEGTVTDIGLGGAQFWTAKPLQRQLSYQLIFTWDGVRIDLECRVKREIEGGDAYPGRRCFGLEFNTTTSQEHRLRRFLESAQGKK